MTREVKNLAPLNATPVLQAPPDLGTKRPCAVSGLS
jgi:hypothetical protein